MAEPLSLWIDIDHYLAERYVPEDPALDAALQASADAGLPPINVTPNLGKLLQLFARLQRATRILEVGTLGGYSTIFLARALPPGGTVITLEVNDHHAAVARENFTRAGVADRIDLRLGRAADTLAQLIADGHPAFDLIFIDADKRSNPDYFNRALQLSRPGTLIIVDNVIRGGGILDADSTDADIQGTRRLHDQVSSDPRVTATALQIVTSKGHDGFTVAVVN